MAATALLAAPAGAEEGGPAASAPVAEAGPAPRSAQLANGDRATLDAAGGLRVTGPDGAAPGSYRFSSVHGRTEVTPTADGPARGTATTVLGGGTEAPARTSRAAVANQRVKIDLVNANHFGGLIHVWNRRTWQYYDVKEEQWDDYGTVSLPPGDYLTIGLYANWQQDSHLLSKTFTVGAAPLTVTLDARLAKPTRIGVDDPSAVRQSADIWFTLPGGSIAGSVGGWGEQVYVTPLSLPGVTLSVHEVLGRKGSTGSRPTPYRYDLVHRFTNGVPANPVAQVRTADLTRTRTTVKVDGAGLTANLAVYPSLGESSGTFASGTVPAGAPFTHYLTPGITFERLLSRSGLQTNLPPLNGPKGQALPAEAFGQAPFTLNAGGRSASTWRRGTLVLQERQLAGPSGETGTDFHATHSYRVTAEGQELGRSGTLASHEQYSLPVNQHATYGIHHTLTRTGAQSRLSPRIETDWLLSSSMLGLYNTFALPVIEARVDVPGLDLRNRAAAGPASVTVSLANRQASYAATLTSVEYSTDDGATWRTAPLTAEGASGTATVDVPAGAGFVSLRISGQDNGGGTVRQTITRAFGGPAAQQPLRIGSVPVSGVTVNGGRPVVAPQPVEGTFPARFTVSSPSGVETAGVVLYHGAFDNPDGATAAPASCTRRVASPVHDCVAQLGFGTTGPGLDKLAGTWSVAVWAHSADRTAQFYGGVPGGVAVQRATSLTITATPQPLTRGKTLTVTGKLSGAAWEYGAPTGLAGQKVELQFRKAGPGTTWSTVGTGVTNATGTVTVKRAAWSDGGWRLRFAGTTAAAGSYSWVDNVDVR
ncbi:hypothetical protein [Streptomyces showdoensis]|uniref:hypothetical protein n=1 Tax=Streptomyces showdoensis TaxID=68268 RepID=UPI000F4D56FD|nr:hypothetical protein [Streptomyces showdoensis]